MNIGMFPLSGIRVCDAELLRLGLTLPGFVERSKPSASLPSLGLLTLAGMTPAPHRVQYVEVPDVNLITSLPSGLDLAAISSYSAQIGEAYDLARRFRAMGVRTVIGGPHVTALPDEAATATVTSGQPRRVVDPASGALTDEQVVQIADCLLVNEAGRWLVSEFHFRSEEPQTGSTNN